MIMKTMDLLEYSRQLGENKLVAGLGIAFLRGGLSKLF